MSILDLVLGCPIENRSTLLLRITKKKYPGFPKKKQHPAILVPRRCKLDELSLSSTHKRFEETLDP